MFDLRIKTMTLLCGMALAGGCGFLKPTTSAQSAVAPASNVAHSASVSDPDYELGRLYQGRMQYEAAIGAYRKSLQLNPGNAEAHNALGVIYASLGRHEQAITELMAALALAPSAAHIHNNLGYTYLLRGRSAEAAAALRVAADLDPANQRARENMKTAETALAQEKDAVAAPVLALPEVVTSSAQIDKRFETSASHLVNLAPNIFELREPPAIPFKGGVAFAPVQSVKARMVLTPLQPMNARAPFAPVQPPKAGLPPKTIFRVEIANGSGVTGLAKRTSSSLRSRGYAVARLTNQIPYTQIGTEIQYRVGEQQRAAEMNALLSQPAKLVESNDLSPLVSIRLLLGRDTGHEVLFTEASAARTAMAGL